MKSYVNFSIHTMMTSHAAPGKGHSSSSLLVYIKGKSSESIHEAHVDLILLRAGHWAHHRGSTWTCYVQMRSLVESLTFKVRKMAVHSIRHWGSCWLGHVEMRSLRKSLTFKVRWMAGHLVRHRDSCGLSQVLMRSCRGQVTERITEFDLVMKR